jgi:hypothetical protein
MLLGVWNNKSDQSDDGQGFSAESRFLWTLGTERTNFIHIERYQIRYIAIAEIKLSHPVYWVINNIDQRYHIERGIT